MIFKVGEENLVVHHIKCSGQIQENVYHRLFPVKIPEYVVSDMNQGPFGGVILFISRLKWFSKGMGI